MDKISLVKLFDHTALKATTTAAEIDKLCAEAREYSFAAVCLNPCWLEKASKALQGTEVMPITVVGFPLGAMASAAKAEETKQAIASGAQEIDMVVPVGHMLDGDESYVRGDIAAVKAACGAVPLKVIIETCYLSPDQVAQVTSWCGQEGADFVKTSTGFGTAGATVEHVKLMRRIVGDSIGVKASGGIRDLASTRAMIAAGANRIGTSSGVAIVKELQEEQSECQENTLCCNSCDLLAVFLK